MPQCIFALELGYKQGFLTRVAYYRISFYVAGAQAAKSKFSTSDKIII
jgi:hypothetical protein